MHGSAAVLLFVWERGVSSELEAERRLLGERALLERAEAAVVGLVFHVADDVRRRKAGRLRRLLLSLLAKKADVRLLRLHVCKLLGRCEDVGAHTLPLLRHRLRVLLEQVQSIALVL